MQAYKNKKTVKTADYLLGAPKPFFIATRIKKGRKSALFSLFLDHRNALQQRFVIQHAGGVGDTNALCIDEKCHREGVDTVVVERFPLRIKEHVEGEALLREILFHAIDRFL